MALDGIVISNIIYELKDKLLGGRIDKIYQPLPDEIIFSVRSIGSNFKVLASANPSHPRIHITQIQKDNPISAPMFCMVLRKYIAGGKIISISQPNFERIVCIEIESMSEMGDKTIKKLMIEIMGKHSNLILVDEKNCILDSIKRISHDKSSVREVLPGKEYQFPPSQNKKNPLGLEYYSFVSLAHIQEGLKLQNFLYQTYTGISPIMASEICFRADLDASSYCAQLDTQKEKALFTAFEKTIEQVKSCNYYPEIIYEKNSSKIIEFSSLSMSVYQDYKKINYDSISSLLEAFYSEKDAMYHIQQKSHDMRKIILSNIERCVKKKEIQIKTKKDTKNKDVWKMKGELITANIHAIQKGTSSFQTVNFYEPEMPKIEIILNPTKTPAENAQHYFNKYNKAKRTLAALEIQQKQNEEELSYLESILNSLENAKEEADIEEIRLELINAGYMKKKHSKKKGQKLKKSKPMHYLSSDGYDIYVGKSNIQNDELTLHFADSNDMWLHTKEIAGSHVIISTKGMGILSDTALLEAAHLAAYHSKGKNGSNVPVDYTLRKNVKKPSGAKPGMVIYEQNKTIYITPNIELISSLRSV